ncbi:hypothetical protein, conserved [Babesia ovata]|uniref:C3H1-type domain-containing protein n=2 Tax=Babesia ovata TaxID=189622 RepID=A0A2H6KKC7_9APIC|nr:uncharacterized protein BOVATA_049340 [Babesia ovata]GBE63441.1 hypothetical protein, conserved [Babesia ovata]
MIVHAVQVGKATGNVSTELGWLKEHLSGKYTEQIHNTQGLQEQLKEWKTTLTHIEKHVEHIKSNVNKLDKPLHSSITRKIEPLSAAVKFLLNSAKSVGLEHQVLKVDTELLTQRANMENAIRMESVKVEDTLKAQIERIGNAITTLKGTKERHFDEISAALRVAKENVDKYYKEFEKEFKDKITRHFDEIKNALHDVDKDSPFGGDKVNTRLNRDVTAIKTVLLKVGDELSGHVTNLEEKISTAAETMDSALLKVESILQEVEGEKAVNKRAVDTAVPSLKERTEQCYVKSKTEELKGYAHEACEKLEKLANAVEKMVDETFSSVQENYLALIQGVSATGLSSTVQFTGSQLQQWNQSAEQMHSIGQNVDGVIKQHGHKYSELLQTLQTSSPLIRMQQLHRDLPGLRAFLQKRSSAANATDVTRHHQTLSSYASATKLMTNAFVDSLIVEIQNAVHSAATLSVDSDVQQLTHSLGIALQNASQFAHALQSLDTKRVRSSRVSISEISRQVGILMQSVQHFHISFTRGKTFIQDFDIGISQNFNRLLQSVKNAADEKSGLQQILTAFKTDQIGHKTNVSGSVGQVHQELKTLHTKEFTEQLSGRSTGSITSRIQSAIKTVIDIVGELEKAPQCVDRKKEEMGKLMDYIKEQFRLLQGNISFICQKVHLAQKALSKAIQDLLTTLNSAYRNCNDALSNLKNDLLETTNKAFQTLTSAIQSLFSASHAADLQALRALVDQQLREVQTIIARDAVTGVKGMLKVLRGVPITAKSAVDDKYNLLHILKTVVPSTDLKAEEYATKFSEASKCLRNYLDPFVEYIESQAKNPPKNDGQPPLPTEQSAKVRGIQNAVDDLLKHLSHHEERRIDKDTSVKRIYIFDDLFTTLLHNLSSSISSLSPSTFHGFHNPLLLDALRRGMGNFTEKLSRAYVNAYSGKTFTQLVIPKTDNDPQSSDKLSTEGRNCAKVCLTILERVSEDLMKLKERCKYEWHSKEIHRISGLGAFLKDCGYIVSNRDKQDGELRRHENMTGNHILQKLTATLANIGEINKHLKECESNKKNGTDTQPQNDDVKVFAILSCLITHFSEYNKVGHIATFSAKRTPCSVYEMLSWCCGLEYNSAYSKMQQHCKTLHQALEKEEKENEKMKDVNAYLKTILSKVAEHGLPYLSSNSRNLLTAIAGHGDAETFYGCEFSNNSLSLKYPGSGAECLDMLLDILRRLFLPLRFLDAQCSLSNKHYGWANCQYGKDIAPVNWPCKDHSTNKPNGQSASKPTCQANDQPNGQPNCRPTSPLMSYLNDCLPGHLPHQLTDAGCKSSCSTCKTAARGVPCLTPLGFRGFSGSTRLGKELCNVLTKMLDDAELRSLFCLKPKTPATLPEHFGFVLSMVRGWDRKREHSMLTWFDESITKQSIELYSDNALTGALRDAYGSSQSTHDAKKHQTRPVKDAYNEPSKADVSSLSMTITCPGEQCAPYVASLCGDTYAYFAEKHCNTYLSWAIYLPWTFWDLLNNLYNAFCEITCADWGCRGCLRGDKCKSGKHGVVEDEKNQDATCQCDSIVKCRGVAPTLYQYGFTFGEASTLNSGSTVKKCSDFCSQLRNVLHSEYFQKLFEECDNFLKAIRWPFMLTLLALWSLSLLYLLHIAVVRLDVLRIRSHLRSPSSHRIAAQSLLAAARVKALANVKYFSP